MTDKNIIDIDIYNWTFKAELSYLVLWLLEKPRANYNNHNNLEGTPDWRYLFVMVQSYTVTQSQSHSIVHSPRSTY